MRTPEQQIELAKLALEMLARVELRGKEVPAFVEVSNWLNDLAQPTPSEKPISQ